VQFGGPGAPGRDPLAQLTGLVELGEEAGAAHTAFPFRLAGGRTLGVGRLRGFGPGSFTVRGGTRISAPVLRIFTGLSAIGHKRTPFALFGGFVPPSATLPGYRGRPTSQRGEVPAYTLAMRTHVAEHPLIAHKLTALRDLNTDSPTFRRLADELVTLLAYEATRDVRVTPVDVDTPVARARGVRLAAPKPLVVPILRAGLGMLDGMVRLLPTAEVGFLGMVRDEGTLTASTYATRMPDDLSDRQCYVLDPMLATGGTLAAAIRLLAERGARDVTAICLLAAPEGLAKLEADLAGDAIPVTVVTAAVDERLNEHGYIVPGLGDAGDRLYGIV